MTNVPLPRLLDATGAEVARLNPASLSVDLSMNQVSSADMTVEMTDVVIPMRSWVEIFTIHGSAGIFRVSQMDTDYDRDEQRLTLEHGLCALRDAIMPGDDEEEKTPSQWLDAILARQTAKRGNTALWAKGTVAPSTPVYITPNDATLLDILSSVMEQLPDYMIVTDQSVFPWTISIAAKPTSITAEGRLTRNLSSVRVSYDDSDLCTRVYANGLTGGYMDADTASTYGIVEQSLYLDEDTSATDAARLATHYLNKRKEPAISVELDAVDLYEATGENWDSFTLGKKFRLALPSYGVNVEQWITGLNYQDVYGDPEHVTVTLANEVADLAQRMAKTEEIAHTASTASEVNSSRIGSTQKTVEIHDTKLETADEYWVKLDDLDILRKTSAGVVVGDAMVSLLATVTDTYGNVFTKDSIIQAMRTAGLTVDATKSLVEIYATEQIARKGATDTNAANLTVASNAITAEVNRATTAEGNLSSRITVNAEGIETKVSKNGVISAIRQSAESVKIQASKIELEGYVNADNFASKMAAAGWLEASQLSVGSGGFTCNSYVTLFGNNAEWKSCEVVYSASKTNSTAKLELSSGATIWTSVLTDRSYRTIHYLGQTGHTY